MRASFSSTGPQVDVACTGCWNSFYRADGSCSLCDPSGYTWLSGTSMAAPHVAGLGALLRSRGWSAMEAASLMTTTAVDLGAPGFDSEYGYGRVDALAATGGAPAAAPLPPAPPADSVAPVVAITAPTNGSAVVKRANVTIQATASDNLGVAVWSSSSTARSAAPTRGAIRMRLESAKRRQVRRDRRAGVGCGGEQRPGRVTVTFR
jgi:subtilisin family serine protease